MIWAWTLWLLGIAGTFAALEGYALARNKLTLSRYTYNLSAKWTPIIWLSGMVVGGLVVHFWWHWCPPGSVQGG